MKKTAKKVALALGESTHTHMLSSKAEIKYEDVEKQPASIDFELEGTGATITHEEHDRIVLEAGKYSKTNQVEFNPMDASVSQVFD
jgi:hypothetical protein